MNRLKFLSLVSILVTIGLFLVKGGLNAQESDDFVLYRVVDTMPTFNGKDAENGFRDYVFQNIVCPKKVMEKKITGYVVAEFIIEKDGSMGDVKIIQKAHPLLDAEVLRVIKESPKWTPGIQKGEPVNVKYLFPINFCFKPIENNPALLVGEIIFIGSNYVCREGISFIGETYSGIDIVLKNTCTNEILRFSSGQNGLFYIDLQEGKYLIDELCLIKKREDGAWCNICCYPIKKELSIERGIVNNVGRIRWTYDGRIHFVKQRDDSSAVKNEFSEQFPESIWKQKKSKFKPIRRMARY